MTPQQISQERARLLAGVLNMMAASSFTLTVIAPLVTASACTAPGGVSLGRIIAGACAGVFITAALHSYAARVLDAGLQE